MRTRVFTDNIGDSSKKYFRVHLCRRSFISVLSLSLVLCLTAFCFTGCAAETRTQNLLKGVKRNQVADNDIDNVVNDDVVPIADLASGSAKITNFAATLFKTCAERGNNVLISPVSVITVLAAAANGAKGETLREIEETLGMKKKDLNDFLFEYAACVKSSQGKSGLCFADSIWLRKAGLKADDDFLHTVADHIDADVYAASFDGKTKKDINGGVKKKTCGMIPEIVREIPKETVMYLVSALACENEWRISHEKKDMRVGEFTCENGERKSVEFMYSREFAYLEDKNAKGFIKYGADEKIAFAALLPNEGTSLSEYVSSLDGEKLRFVLTNPKIAAVDAEIPKFEIDCSLELSDVLKKAGITAAFDENKADFSGIGKLDAGNLFISGMVHETYVSVNEKGANADTTEITGAVGTEHMPLPESQIQKVILDRPFVYLIIDLENRVPLLMGLMADPSVVHQAG